MSAAFPRFVASFSSRDTGWMETRFRRSQLISSRRTEVQSPRFKSSQSLYGKPTIDHDDLACGIRQGSAGQSRDRLPHIFGRAPSALNRQAFAEQLVILFLHADSHVGLDDAGAHLVHRDGKLAKPGRPKVCRHRHTSLGDAVFAPVHRRDGSRDRRDIDDAPGEIRVGFLLFDHPLRHLLREKIRALQVRPENMFETRLRRLQNVTAFFWRDTGIIDQYVQPTETPLDCRHHSRACVAVDHVALAVQYFGAELAQCRQCIGGSALVSHTAHGEVESVACQSLRDTETDAARTAGDQSDAFHIRPSNSGSKPTPVSPTTRYLSRPTARPWRLPAVSRGTARLSPRGEGTTPTES